MNESVPQRLEKSTTVFACVYCSFTDLFPAYCLIANYTRLHADILTIYTDKGDNRAKIDCRQHKYS